MSQSRGTVLLVEDEADLLWLLAGCLKDGGYRVIEAENAEVARERYDEYEIDVVVSDVRMPGASGVELLADLRTIDERLPFILMSAVGDVQTAVDAMKLGAYDWLSKPLDHERLLHVVERAAETGSLRQELARLRSQLESKGACFGHSAAARELDKRLSLIAETDVSVLLEGESGTGKEVAARTIHERSPRAAHKFVAVDCGALPENLLESLLFGHVRGAFTGAEKDRTGIFVEAAGGTLFLDELGNLPLGLQAKLLRCLQEREIRPLGSEHAQKIDVRVIAAANQDLVSATQEGSFRLDLYHRVAEFVVQLPALRERNDDIAYFSETFLAQIAEELARDELSLEPDAQEALSEYSWPGNLRELLNVLRRAAILAADSRITRKDLQLPQALPTASRSVAADLAGFEAGLPLTEQVQRAAAQLEARWIRDALDRHDGNKAAAARELGIDYTTLHRKLKKLD